MQRVMIGFISPLGMFIGNSLRRLETPVKASKLVEFVVDHIAGSYFDMIKH